MVADCSSPSAQVPPLVELSLLESRLAFESRATSLSTELSIVRWMCLMFSLVFSSGRRIQPNWHAKTARGDHGAEVVEVTDIIQ